MLTHFIASQPMIAKMVTRHMDDLEEMRRRDSAPVRACIVCVFWCRESIAHYYFTIWYLQAGNAESAAVGN